MSVVIERTDTGMWFESASMMLTVSSSGGGGSFSVTRTMQRTGEIEFSGGGAQFWFEEADLILGLSTLNPFAPDDGVCWITDPSLPDCPEVPIWLVETGPDTGVFIGTRELDDEDRTTYYRHTIVEDIAQHEEEHTGPGTLNGFVWEIAGPATAPGIESYLTSVEIAGKQYQLERWHGRLIAMKPIRIEEPEAGLRPATMYAARAHEADPARTPNYDAGEVVPPIRWESAEAGQEFIRGFGNGLWDTGASIIDDGESLCKIAWAGIRKYNTFSVAWRIVTEGTPIAEEDRATVKAFGQGIGQVADFANQLYGDSDLIAAAILGDADAIRQLGAAYHEEFQLVANILNKIVEELRAAAASPRQVGWVMGRIVGEVAIEVLAGVATAGGSVAVTAVRRALQVAKIADKLGDVAKLSRVIDAVQMGPNIGGNMGNIGRKAREGADELRRACPIGACFVAGTLVLTSCGPVPIECVRPGDQVVARDSETGVMTLARVDAAFTRVSDDLITVRYSNEKQPRGKSAAKAHLTCTVITRCTWRTGTGSYPRRS